MSEEAQSDPVPALIELIGAQREPQRGRLLQLLERTPVPAGRTALSLEIARLADFALRSGVFSLPDIRWPDSIRYGFVEFNDAIVTPSGFVIAGGHVIFDAQMMPVGWLRAADRGRPQFAQYTFRNNFIHELNFWRETCVISVPDDLPAISEPVFLFNSRQSCANFTHLVHDTLIQTPSFHDCCAELGENVRPMLAGPAFRYPMMGEVFARALAPRATQPIFTGAGFHRVARLFVPTTHFDMRFRAIARGAVARLLRTLGAELAPYRTGAKRRIFISRADARRPPEMEPRFDNEEALDQALGALGFEKLVLSRLDVCEYFAAFVNSEIVAGLHGAGLGNAILSASPRLLEIVVPTPPFPDWRAFEVFMQNGMGIPYRRVEIAPPVAGVAHYDVAAIVEAGKALLATPCPQPGPPL